MGFKIKGLNSVKKSFKKIRQDSKREFLNQAAKKAKKIIINDTILQGQTPVDGGKWKRPYSKSYRDQIIARRGKRGSGIPKSKRTTPVNLKLKGTLLKSFTVAKRIFRNGLIFKFTDKKAEYHQEERNMLPIKRGQIFNPDITFKLTQLLDRAVKKAIRKNR